jgi:DNA mismatch repair ATPase MutL
MNWLLSDEKNQNQAKSDAPLGTKQLRSPGSAVKECLPNDQQQNMRDDDSAAADSATQQHVAVSDDADSSAEGTALQQSKKMPRTDSSQAKSRASDNSKKAADSCDSEGAQSVAANEDSEQNRNTQGDHDAGWFTGWNLTPLTHLTGAVKNTVNVVVKSVVFIHADSVQIAVMMLCP